MIRSQDVALRTALAAAPVDSSLAAFEAAIMAHCASPPTQVRRNGRSASPMTALSGPRLGPGIVVELASAPAANRYVQLLAPLNVEAEVLSVSHGCRHQYDIFQVRVPVHAHPVVINRQRRALQSGMAILAGNCTSMYIPRQHAIAIATWRAALLVIGPGRGADLMRLRVAADEAASAMVRAAAVLDVGVGVARRPGGLVLSVSGAGTVRALLGQVTGAEIMVGERIPA